MLPRSGVWVIVLASASFLVSGSAFGQSRGGATGSGSGSGSGGTSTGGSTGVPTPSRTPGNIPGNPAGTTPTGTQRPPTLFITGRVALEDGGTPPDTATIERVCNGSSIHAEGYTDSRGYFSIEVGNELGVFQDASETSSYNSGSLATPVPGVSSGTTSAGGRTMSSDMRYVNCELRARLTGYRSQVVSLANRRPLDDPNIGTILLHRISQDEGTTVSMVSLTAPHSARSAFEKGLQLLKKNRTAEAEKQYKKAVEIYPKYAAAWNELGRIQAEREQYDAARQSFRSAIQADPKYVNPYLQLSLISMHSRNWRELADVTAQALKLDPFDYPQAYLFNGVANWNLKDVDAAEKSVRQAEKLDGQHTLPQICHLMGMILIVRHDLAGAAERLRLYLKLDPTADDADKAQVQLTQVEKLLAQNSTAEKQDH